MGNLKKKSPKKLSLRKRQRLENSHGAFAFGEIPAGQKFALATAVDKFIRASSCRHMQSMGSPCESFDEATSINIFSCVGGEMLEGSGV
jgi:hypothetical protein